MTFNKKFYEKYGLKITKEPVKQHNHDHLSPTIERLFKAISNKTVTPKILNELESLVLTYPDVLSLKNYLYLAYLKTDQDEKALDYLKETLRLHPDYFFALSNLAAHYFSEKQYNRAADVLKEPFDVRNLAKDEIIHESVFMGYYKLAINIEIKRDNNEQAEELLRILFDYDKNHEDVKTLGKEITLNQGTLFSNMKARNHREVESISKPISGQFLSDSDGNPIFNHQEINQLYTYSLDNIPPEVIKSILSLPRQTLIKDLEHVLCDTVLRFDYFYRQDNWEDETHSFTIHALYLLTELRAYESLPCILDIFRQDTGFREFWFSDYLEEFFNEPIYLLGEKQLNLLKTFVLEENLDEWFRLVAVDAVAQVAIKQPERRSEAIEWFREVIQYHLENSENDNLIDSSFLAILVNDIMNCRGIELKEEIKQLYAQGWISNFDNGKLTEVLAELEKPFDPYDNKPLPNDIFELYNKKYEDRRAKSNDKEYDLEELKRKENDPFQKFMRELRMQKITQALSNFKKMHKKDDDFEDDFEDDDYDWTPQLPVKREEPKVGRNDPCPCGSGKKYKKCHGK